VIIRQDRRQASDTLDTLEAPAPAQSVPLPPSQDLEPVQQDAPVRYGRGRPRKGEVRPVLLTAVAKPKKDKPVAPVVTVVRPPKRARVGRPRKEEAQSSRKVVFELPPGMSDKMLAWACGLKIAAGDQKRKSHNTVYRWKTEGNPPQEALDMVALWLREGQESFVRIVSEMRGAPPPVTEQKRPATTEPSVESLILEILEAGPVSTSELYTVLTEVYGRTSTKGSVKTLLSRLVTAGKVIHGGKDAETGRTLWQAMPQKKAARKLRS
jgi:hypothetical protein